MTKHIISISKGKNVKYSVQLLSVPHFVELHISVVLWRLISEKLSSQFGSDYGLLPSVDPIFSKFDKF